jgi:hypothetical protein
MFQSVCAPRGWAGGSGGGSGCGSGGGAQQLQQQTERRRELWLLRALPPPARFDRETHLKIMNQIHAHLSAADPHARFQCHGVGGNLFFAMRMHRPWLLAFPRYPQAVCWR